MTAIGAAMRKAGVDLETPLAYAKACELLHVCGNDMVAASAALTQAYRDMKGFGHKADAGVPYCHEGHGQIGAREQNEGDGVQTRFDGHFNNGPSPSSPNRSDAVQKGIESPIFNGHTAPVPIQSGAVQIAIESHQQGGHSTLTPNKPRSLAEIERANTVLRPSRFDTYKMMDGQMIGDIRYADAQRMIPRHKREAALLQLLLDHGHPTNNWAKFRDYIKESVLETAIQKAAEMSDAA